MSFEEWLRSCCFQKPTPEAYDLAKCAWNEANSLKDLFKLDKNEAKRRLAHHEENGTLAEQVNKHHPFYMSAGEVAKFTLIRDLGL